MILSGIGASGGIAVGRLVLVGGVVADWDIEATTDRPVEESLARLADALAVSRTEIATLAEGARERLGADSAAIIEIQLLVLDDPEWLDQVRDAVSGGATPEAAAWAMSQGMAGQLAALDDPYLRERSADVLDVGRRVVGHLTGRPWTRPSSELSGEVVIGAHELMPTDTLDLDPEVVRGIVTEGGARTSHAAIIARQLGIPAVVGATGLLDHAREGDLVVLDGDAGLCTLDPDPGAVEAARASVAARAAEPVIADPVATRDGVQVAVLANASSPQDVARAVGWGADGIGLFRTEFLFMQSASPPDEEAQTAYYSAAAEAAQGRPVTFRTLDVGGDKPVPGLHVEAEENPFLGVRGVRLTLANRPLFEVQLRALARTAERHPGISVMVPMVSGLDELDAVHALLDEVVPGAPFRFGTMVEVPSAALLAEDVAAEVDFLSVGTNDLTAYVLAADRGNPHLHELYDEFHPALLRLLRLIRIGAGVVPVSVCGEMAGDPRSLALLVGLGYRQLSVSGPLVAGLKRRVRLVHAGDAADALAPVLGARRMADVAAALDDLGRAAGGGDVQA